MAYSTPHTFYVDYVNGSNATRSTLADVVFSNPSGDIVRGTYVSHGLVNGAIITVSGCTQAYANDQWEIESVAENTFDLVGASWASFNGADVTGNVVPHGGSSWADAWLTCLAGGTTAKIKPGVTFKVAKSTAPISLGKTGAWKSPTTTGGIPVAKSISSSTNATPIQVNCVGHGFETGNLVHINNHAGNVAANGIWTITYVSANAFTLDDSVGSGTGTYSGTAQKTETRVVELASAETELLDNGDVAWTASGSSSCSIVTTSAPTGYAGAKVAKSSPANSTLYAYKTLTEVDLSGYQAICLWILTSYSIASADQISICLCSDTAGATVVDTFKIPAMTYPTGKYIPVKLTKEGGGNLGSSIKSIAIYSGSSAPSNISFQVDNINACKSSGLALPMLISKNSAEQGGDEGWWAIRALYGKYVLLEASRGYFGTTETVTTYAREASAPLAAFPSSYSTLLEGFSEAGTDGTENVISGGWNTSSGLQDGETFLDGLASWGVFTPQNYCNIDHLNFARMYAIYGASYVEFTNTQSITSVQNGVYLMTGITGIVDLNTVKNIIGCDYGIRVQGATSVSWTEIKNLHSNATYGVYGLCTTGTRTKITSCCNNGIGIYLSTFYGDLVEVAKCDYNATYGFSISGPACNLAFQTIGSADYNGTSGIYLTNSTAQMPSDITIGTIQASNNGGFGIQSTCNAERIHIGTLTTTDNVTAALQWANGQLQIDHATLAEATKVSWYTSNGTPDALSYVGIAQLGATAGRWYRETYYGIISDQITAGQNAAWAYGGAGISLYFNPNSANTPLKDEIYIPCTASAGIQVHFQVKKTSSEANPTMTITAIGAGITPIWDASVTLTDSWAEFTSATMTPTFDGFIRITLKVYDGSTTGDVGIDDIHYAAAA
jgi:hypothetical protein